MRLVEAKVGGVGAKVRLVGAKLRLVGAKGNLSSAFSVRVENFSGPPQAREP